MGLYKIKIKSPFTLDQQNELYNKNMELMAVLIGYQDFIKQENLTDKCQIFMEQHIKTFTYNDLRARLLEKKEEKV